ncbi:MAG: collagen-like protein [Planctomycetes bacterium]|nr:collagen-like protein [Planctomycetota bacterium]
MMPTAEGRRRFVWFRCGVAVIASAAILGAGAQRGLAVPPRVMDLNPPPGDWVTGDEDLTSVEITFDMPVMIPEGAVVAHTITGGLVDPPPSLDPEPGSTAQVWTISFAPVSSDRITVFLDYSITNALGEALDGEAFDSSPSDPLLPTGDGIAGGQAVFQFTVLQGDIDQSGTVDANDSLILGLSLCQCGEVQGADCPGGCADCDDANGDEFLCVPGAEFCDEDEPGDDNYNAGADLNDDGTVDCTDLDILLEALIESFTLPETDGNAAIVESVSETLDPATNNTALVTFTEAIDPSSVLQGTVHAVGLTSGEVIRPLGPGTPDDQSDMVFAFEFGELGCLEVYAVSVSHVIDPSGSLSTPNDDFVSDGGTDVTPPTIVCPLPAYVNSTTATELSAEDFANSTEIAAFLAGAIADDECTVEVTTSVTIDDPVALPLGVTMVQFVASDSTNTTTCDAPIIVVQSVPLPGDDGEDGQDGEDGEDGVDGAPGETGPAGPQGPSGSGSTGSAGADGEPGEKGEKGDSGDDGSPGDAGADGGDGLDGADGATGEPGPAGADGAEGSAGTTGLPGEPAPAQDVPDTTTAEDDESTSTTSSKRPCIFGMVSFAMMIAGLSLMSVGARRSRNRA